MECVHVIQTIGKEHLHCEQQIEQQDEPMTEAWWKGRWKRKECKFLRRQGPAKEKRNKKFDDLYSTIYTHSRFLPLSAFYSFNSARQNSIYMVCGGEHQGPSSEYFNVNLCIQVAIICGLGCRYIIVEYFDLEWTTIVHWYQLLQCEMNM